MNNLSAKTIIAVDTDNYTAWTSLTSCIMATGSLLMAAGWTAWVQRRQQRRSVSVLNNVKHGKRPCFLCLPEAVKLQVDLNSTALAALLQEQRRARRHRLTV